MTKALITSAVGNHLANYDKARRYLELAVKIDEVARIKDAAAKMEAYARLRDDAEVIVWTSEIKRRAGIRIGEISRELETAKANQHKARLPNVGKKQALADAGISTSQAHRLEELAGGKTEQGIKAAKNAAEQYFAEARLKGIPSTDKGLRAAIRDAVHAVAGITPGKKNPAHKLPKNPASVTLLTSFSSRVSTIAEFDFQGERMSALASNCENVGEIDDYLSDARKASKLLSAWLATLSKERKKRK